MPRRCKFFQLSSRTLLLSFCRGSRRWLMCPDPEAPPFLKFHAEGCIGFRHRPPGKCGCARSLRHSHRRRPHGRNIGQWGCRGRVDHLTSKALSAVLTLRMRHWNMILRGFTLQTRGISNSWQQNAHDSAGREFGGGEGGGLQQSLKFLSQCGRLFANAQMSVRRRCRPLQSPVDVVQ